MLIKPTGSARDPLPSKYKSSSPTTPGLGWVIGGFVAICVVVALAQAPSVQHVAERMASITSSQG